MTETLQIKPGAICTVEVCRHHTMGSAVIRAVDGISFSAQGGDFIALLGSSGSGKSSLLNLIAGLDRPTSGDVQVDGRSLAELSSEELARHRRHNVGMVFQSFNLVPSMTVEENVELPLRLAETDRRERPGRVKEALARVGLSQRLAHRPGELSGGEQQRVALARALVNSPRILLADEPTGNLDSRTGTEIMELIRDCNQRLGMTILLVTHEHALAERYAGRMLFLADGKLVDDRMSAPRVEGGERKVKTPDLLELAARNLRESMLRNSLTTLGIGVGVASLVAMLSLGIGLQQLATRRLERTGLFDTVIVSRRDVGGFGGRNRLSTVTDNNRVLNEDARREIAALPGVLEAVPDLRMMTQIRFDGKLHRAVVAALPFSARDREAFETIQGKFFSSGAAAEAILQRGFAQELLGLPSTTDDNSNSSEPAPALQALLGKELVISYAARIPAASPRNPEPSKPSIKPSSSKPNKSADAANGPDSADALVVGFSVVPRTQSVRIVGIVNDDPDTLRGMGRARLFVPLDFAQGLRAMLPSDLREGSGLGDPTYTQVSVRVRSSRDVLRVEDAVHRMGFGAFSVLDASRNLQRFFAVLDLFLGIFGSLALAVASLGIVNTLVMAILERRREIGILKALGASDLDVKKLFFAEAGAMGIVGGVVGVALGWIIGKLINAGTNIYMHRQNLPSETFWSVPWWLVLGAMLFSLAVSLISGLYPAASAAKLDPVKALRYE